MVYMVSSCFFFMVSFLFLIVAQLELEPTPFTEDPNSEAAPAVLKWSGQEVGGTMSSYGCG